MPLKITDLLSIAWLTLPSLDRLLMDKDLDRPRLRESLETALKVGKGIILINETLYSEFFACADCGISMPEIEPRLFSFNSPYGACSHCTGLGSTMEVDPELVIPNKKLTLAEGAIKRGPPRRIPPKADPPWTEK